MNDPFKEFGGQAIEGDSDPFKEFGGKAVQAKPESDPFAEFGGQALQTAPTPAAAQGPTETGQVSMQQLDSIFRKHGLTSEEAQELRGLTPYLGVSIEGSETPGLDTAKKFLGTISPGRDIAAGAHKWFRSDNYKGAMDDLTALAAEQRTYPTAIAHAATSVVGAIGMAGKAAQGAKALGFGTKAAVGAEVAAQAGAGAAGGYITGQEGTKGVSAALGGSLGAMGEVLPALPAAIRRAVIGGGLGAGLTYAALDEEADPEDKVQAMAKGLAIGAAVTPLAGLTLAKTAPRHVAKELADKTLQTLASPAYKEAEDKTVQATRSYLGKLDEARVVLAVENKADQLYQGASDLGVDLVALAKRTGSTEVNSIGEAVEHLNHLNQTKPALLESSLRDLTKEQTIQREMYNEVMVKGNNVDPSFFNTALRAFQRAPGAAGIIDDRSGGLLQAERRVIEHTEASQLAMNEAASFVARFTDQVKPHAISVPASVQDAWARSGAKGLSEADLQKYGPALQFWQSYYKEAMDKANSLAVPGSATITASKTAPNYLRREIKGEQDTISTLIGLSKDPAQRPALVQALSYLHDVPEVDIGASPDLLQGLLKKATTPASLRELYRNKSMRPKGLGAAMSRADVSAIPDVLRETNMGKVAATYVERTFQHTLTAPKKAALFHEIQKAKAIGDFEGARFLENHLTSLTSGLDGPAAYVSKKANELLGKMAASDSKLVRDTASILPDLMDMSTHWMYSGMTGFASLSNFYKTASAPWVNVAPELGASGNALWSARVATKAWADVLGDTASGLGERLSMRVRGIKPPSEGTLSKDVTYMYNKGFLPKSLSQEVSGAMTSGVQEGIQDISRITAMTKGAIQRANKVADTAMGVDKATEIMNRVICFKSATRIVDEALSGAKEAQEFISHLPPAYQKELGHRLNLLKVDSGNQAFKEETRDILSSYLIGRTVHFYAKEHQALYAKYLGRWAAAFSTWPTATATDVLRRLYQGKEGETQILRRYMAPLVALKGLDLTIHKADESGETENRVKAATGSQGFAGAAAIGDVGRVFRPETPMMKTAGQLGSAILGDPSGMGREKSVGDVLGAAAVTYTPIAGVEAIMKRLTSIRTFATGEAPPKGMSIPERVRWVKSGDKD